MAAGFGVDMQVQPTADAEVALVNSSGGEDRPRVWTVTAKNTGSKSFVGRLHLEVGGDAAWETWSDRFVLAPGTSAARELAFYDPDVDGPVNTSIELEYGDRQTRPARDRFNASGGDAGSGLRVRSAVAYADRLVLGIVVPEDAGRVFVTVEDDAVGRFGQTAVDDRSGYVQVAVPYSPAIEERTSATVTVFDERGRYHYTKEHSVPLRDPAAIPVGRIVDSVSGILHVFFTRGIGALM